LKAYRGVGKLSLLLLRSSSSFMKVLPGEDDELRNWRQRCKWEEQLEHETVVKNLWERDCFYFMIPISSPFFNFVKPWVIHYGKQFLFVEIRSKTQNSYKTMLLNIYVFPVQVSV